MKRRRKYSVIVADPPWAYSNRLSTRGSPRVRSRVDDYYAVMPLARLKELDVESMAARDCLLFMWTTGPFLAQALELGKAWGFAYSQVAFVWDKGRPLPGTYTVTQCEFVLLFKRHGGKVPARPSGDRTVRQMVRVLRTAHSVKPDQVMDGVDRMFPAGRRVELFARRRRPGWDAYGDQLRGGFGHVPEKSSETPGKRKA